MNKLTIIVSLAAGLALQSVANAGAHVVTPVSVVNGSSSVTASGSIVSAAGSNDAIEYIGCSLGATATSWTITCLASDAASPPHGAGCIIENPSSLMMQAVSSINDTSYIQFSYPISGTVCSNIQVSNDSAYL